MLKHVSSSSSAGNTFSSTPNAVYSNCNKFTKYDSKMDSISLNSSASSNDSSLNDSSEVTESTNRSWRSSSASLHSFESPKVSFQKHFYVNIFKSHFHFYLSRLSLKSIHVFYVKMLNIKPYPSTIIPLVRRL